MTAWKAPLRLARAGPALALALAFRAAPPLAAQRDTTVVAGPEFAASPLQEILFGDDYRDVWIAPVRVEVLDLERFAGGLWFRVDIRGTVTVLSLAYARGADRGRFYFDYGVPF